MNGGAAPHVTGHPHVNRGSGGGCSESAAATVTPLTWESFDRGLRLKLCTIVGRAALRARSGSGLGSRAHGAACRAVRSCTSRGNTHLTTARQGFMHAPRPANLAERHRRLAGGAEHRKSVCKFCGALCLFSRGNSAETLVGPCPARGLGLVVRRGGSELCRQWFEQPCRRSSAEHSRADGGRRRR